VQEAGRSGNNYCWTDPEGTANRNWGDPCAACQAPTFTLSGVPFAAPANNVASLSSTTWPTDYCIDFDVIFLAEQNSNQYDYQGAVAQLGGTTTCDNLVLYVTHTTKLLSGSGMGFMALINCQGSGPH